MKEWFKIVGIGLAVLLALLVLGFGLRGANLFTYKFWAPQEENARREVFENTKSFNQGTIQELAQAYKEYHAPGATDTQKAALKAVVRHQTADFDIAKMPPYLAAWVGQLRQE